MEKTQQLINSLEKAVCLYEERLKEDDVLLQKYSVPDVLSVINNERAILKKVSYGALLAEYQDTKQYRDTIKERWHFGALAARWDDIRRKPLPTMPDEVKTALNSLKAAIREKMNDICDMVVMKTNKFRALLNGDETTKAKTLEQLHSFIDGQQGANVGWPLVKAWQEGLLVRFPNEEEFKDEFELVGKWWAIKRCNDKERAKSDKPNYYLFDV